MKAMAPTKADFQRSPVAAVPVMTRIHTFLKASGSGAIGGLPRNL